MELDTAIIPKVGQVMRAPSGKFRLVRAVHICKTKRMRNPYYNVWIYFTIGHCSWTGRCYTLYNLAELNRMGYKLLDVKVNVKGFGQKISEVCDKGSTELKCCDVVGIP